MDELLARFLLYFDSENEYYKFDYENTVETTNMQNLCNYSNSPSNTLLVNILTNAEELIKELNNSIDYIKSTYKKTDINIKIPEKNLVKISPIFKGISNYARQFANKNKLRNYLHEDDFITINFYDNYIAYIYNCISHLTIIKKLVNTYFGIDNTLSKEYGKNHSLFVNAFQNNIDNGLNLPNSTYLFALQNDTIVAQNHVINTSSEEIKPNIILLNDLYNDFFDNSDFDLNEEIEKHNIRFLHHYKCNDIVEILNVLFYQMLNSKSRINKCKNCKKYFIPRFKSNEKYCDNASPQNPEKTCKEYGAQQAYRAEIKSQPIKNIHNNISQKYRMRINRSKTEAEKRKNIIEFNKYKNSYQKKKSDYKSGILSEIDFLKWLDEKKEVEQSD